MVDFLKFLVLDGNSILNRAFYGIRMLSNKKGQMTNAIYGFLSTFQKLLKEIEPSAVAIAFDLPAPTFRHKMYDGYKATRKKMPQELASQLPILKELLIAMGYKLVMLEGYEADDILGTFANYCESQNYECVLATGDRDSLQLISSKVTVRIATTKFGKAEAVLYDKNKVIEDYGTEPSGLIDIKALQGDTSDNIPGVKGIGEKTAKDLIIKFGSIKNIYENLESLDIKQSIKDKLKISKDMAFLSYELGKINKSVPFEIIDTEYTQHKPNNSKVREILTELEFFSFLEKMNLSCENSEKEEIFAQTESDYEKLFKLIKNHKIVSFFADINNFEIKKLFIKLGKKVYIVGSSITEFLNKLATLKEVKKITYDIKKLARCLKNIDLKFLENSFDVMLASYILNPSSKDYDILKMAEEYRISRVNVVSENNLNDDDKSLAERAYFIEKLAEIFENELASRNQLELLENIEQPLALVLADMENTGFLVDQSGLLNYGQELEMHLKDVQKSIYNAADFEFNINSPKQLGFVLFEKLNLPKGKKGKTGYSTSADTLEKLKGSHEIIDMILEYRALSKLKSTYCDGMTKLIGDDGRIHSSFNQTETRTGRISSAEPNLQNIPVRTERGRELRKFFRAENGNLLIDADYSQIELRVLAHVSGDEAMINAFNNGEDIHAITASQIFNVPIEMVTSQMRFRAKAVNFGIIYGMGAFSLSQDLKVSRYEAQRYIDRYLEHYKGVANYMEKVIFQAKDCGYAETMLSRRRYLPELASSNHMLRSFGERVARNMPIQGSAADIIKIAMINTQSRLKKENLKSKLILQVHDELIIEATFDEAQKVKEILKYEMENALKMKVPLTVNIAVGETWFDAKD